MRVGRGGCRRSGRLRGDSYPISSLSSPVNKDRPVKPLLLVVGRNMSKSQDARVEPVVSQFSIDSITRAASATRKFGFLGQLDRITRE